VHRAPAWPRRLWLPETDGEREWFEAYAYAGRTVDVPGHGRLPVMEYQGPENEVGTTLEA
jgi:hypothetical protein